MNRRKCWLPLAAALALEACNPAASSQHNSTQAADSEQSLNLSQLCMEGARKFFQDVNDPKDGIKMLPGQVASFIAHYNLAMHKCFVLISYSDPNNGFGYSATISDAFEGGDYAAFTSRTTGTGSDHIFLCYEGSSVKQTATCHTRQQWNAIVAKYMGREE